MDEVLLSKDLQAILDKRNNWSLADDRELCRLLETMNSTICSRISNVEDSIAENATKVLSTAVQVSNLNNRLALFASDQFIENRVDNDAKVSTNIISQKVIPKEQAEATNNVLQAVKMGMELMRVRFKRIDLRPEDFDEDDDPMFMPDPVFEPYDENLSRPLPHLIGTADWESSSFAGVWEEFMQKPKVTEEVVVTLPPFTNPKISSCINPLVEESISKTLETESKSFDVESSESDSNDLACECNSVNKEMTPCSQTIFGKERIIKVGDPANCIFDSSENEDSPLCSKVSLIRQSPKISEKLFDPQVHVNPVDLEEAVTCNEAEVLIKQNLHNDSEKEQSNFNEGSTRTLHDLFVECNSDDDDLFVDRKNVTKPQKYINDVLYDATIVNTRSVSEGISNKITENGIEEERKNDSEKKVQNGEADCILPSLVKLRSKGPSRRSPSQWSQHSQKKSAGDVKSLSASNAKGMSVEVGAAKMRKAKIAEEKRADQTKVSARTVNYDSQNGNRSDERSKAKSIFSSDSDDDIFSTCAKLKTGEPDTKECDSQIHERKISFSASKDCYLSPLLGQNQTAVKSEKAKYLFDSDDENTFAHTHYVKGQQQKNEVVVQRVAPLYKEELSARRAEHIPKTNAILKPKRADIFGDDSDDDLFR